MTHRDAPEVVPAPGEKPRKKNFRLYQSKIDRARKAMGAETETEMIDTLLDEAIFRDEIVKGVRAMRGAELVDVFSEEER